VAQQDRAARDRAGAQFGSPVGPDHREVHLGEDDVEHGVEEPLLARDVVVQRHRLDAEATGEGAHRQGGQALRVGKGNRLRDDAVAAERTADGWCRAAGARVLGVIGRHPSSWTWVWWAVTSGDR
jgi:hypothetical protein